MVWADLVVLRNVFLFQNNSRLFSITFKQIRPNCILFIFFYIKNACIFKWSKRWVIASNWQHVKTFLRIMNVLRKHSAGIMKMLCEFCRLKMPLITVSGWKHQQLKSFRASKRILRKFFCSHLYMSVLTEKFLLAGNLALTQKKGLVEIWATTGQVLLAVGMPPFCMTA